MSRVSTTPMGSTAETVAGHFQPRYDAPRLRVASYVAAVARRHGMRPTTLHHMLHGHRPIPQLLAEVIAEAVREGKRHKAQPFADPIEAAIRAMHGVLCEKIIVQAVVADTDEDVARDMALLNPDCAAARKSWQRAIEVERSTKLELWAALHA